MNLHMTMPEVSTAIDALADRYRGAFEKIANGQRQIKAGRTQLKEGRALWIEGTLELAVVVTEARIDYPDHQAFSRWLSRYGLEHMHPNDCMALKGFSRDLQATRKLLEESNSFSWRGIWEKQNKGRKYGPYQIGKGRNSSSSAQTQHDASGSAKRKRAAVIPSVMRDDYVPGMREPDVDPPRSSRRRERAPVQDSPPPPVRKAVNLKGLTREQVDPDFKGTHLEFITEYGHVNLQTKQQIEHHRQQDVLMAWVGLVSDHANTARLLLAAAAVDPATLHEWMAKPGKAAKLRAWCDSAERACESLRKLLPPGSTHV
jgi:hypothetical protein